MSRFRTPLSAALGLGVALSGLSMLAPSTPSAMAAPDGSGLVIREVYGAGGNVGAAFDSDFVELYNPTGAPLSLAGTSLQYRSAGGSPGGTVALSGSVPANSPFLVRMSAAGTAGGPLPAPDATASPAISMAASGGQVILAKGTAAVTASGNLAGATNVIDMFGTSGATSFETAPASKPATATQSLDRSSTGADIDSNAIDFSLAAPSPVASGGGGTTPPPEGGTFSIAQIQGDDTDTSPKAGATVTTTGVVTSSYKEGGLAGFTIQTGGTPDTPGASDGAFVYAGRNLSVAQYPAIGTTVTVTGLVSEYFGLTEINLASATGVETAAEPQPPVVPQTVVPGTDCVLPGTGCLDAAGLDVAREKHESELYQPTGRYTVTDVYDGSPSPSTSSSFFGEIGLAAQSALPLTAPTEVIDAQDTAGIATRTAYNNAHRVILDDGSSTSYTTATGSPFPWFTATHTVRDGAAVSFPKPVVLSYGNGSWKIEPQSQVVGDSTGTVDFAQDRPAAPGNVGGDLRLATFNVLNYFPTTADDYVAMGGGRACTYYSDRDGNHLTANNCTPNGPRGAADRASFLRQQAKIVHAINTLGASIVSLEEIENSVQFGKDRDSAVSTLVDALNADTGSTTWAYAPSPAPADLPPTGDQDVIRTAFIYQPSAISLVGGSKVLTGSAAFSNAREPLAQGFKAKGAPDSDAFAVVVNHFKSKSGVDDGTGQGGSNPDRVAQAGAVTDFADQFSAQLGGTGAIFLSGDFNAYSAEDPVQAIEAKGYANLDSTTNPDEKSYNFGGLAGSLDHVFANPQAKALVTGVDIWNINADESVYYEYSRFNANVTNLYTENPYRASDHNPEVVGLALPDSRVAGRVSALVVPPVARADRTPVNVLVRVAAPGVVPTGAVSVRIDGEGVKSGALRFGVALVGFGPLHHRGFHQVTVSYAGDGRVAPATSTYTILVL